MLVLEKKKELILEFQHVPCGVRQQKTARNLSGHGAGVDACPYFHPGSGRRPPVKEDLFCFRNFRRRQLRDKLPKFDMVSWLCACERMSMWYSWLEVPHLEDHHSSRFDANSIHDACAYCFTLLSQDRQKGISCWTCCGCHVLVVKSSKEHWGKPEDAESCEVTFIEVCTEREQKPHHKNSKVQFS